MSSLADDTALVAAVRSHGTIYAWRHGIEESLPLVGIEGGIGNNLVLALALGPFNSRQDSAKEYIPRDQTFSF